MLEALERGKYPALTDAEVKDLVIRDKWIATVGNGIRELYSTVSNCLAERIGVLAERYAETLPELDAEGAELERAVAGTLEKLGY